MSKIKMIDFLKKQLRNKQWIRHLLIGIICIVVFVILAIISEIAIRSSIVKCSMGDDFITTWVSSLASYWGGILGGVFSGVIAIFGVFYTIQFTREADRNKERQRIQPFLNLKIVAKPFSSIPKLIVLESASQHVNGKTEKSFYDIYLTITNVGNGFANTLKVGTVDKQNDFNYKEVFTVNETQIVHFMVQTSIANSGVEFFILFVDGMSNKYIQSYELRYNPANFISNLDVGYPTLLDKDCDLDDYYA